jgi:hypothetical protein
LGESTARYFSITNGFLARKLGGARWDRVGYTEPAGRLILVVSEKYQEVSHVHMAIFGIPFINFARPQSGVASAYRIEADGDLTPVHQLGEWHHYHHGLPNNCVRLETIFIPEQEFFWTQLLTWKVKECRYVDLLLLLCLKFGIKH